MAKYAMTCFFDENKMLHDADSAYQVLDGWDHKKVQPHLFTSHIEYPHQKFTANSDGTISLNKDPNYVLGCDGRIALKMVERGSEN